MPIRSVLILLMMILSALHALAEGPYYARGSFYAGSGEPWNFDEGNLLHDDGQHDDGAAGDGIYGGWVTADQEPGWHDWKIANADWTENYPNHPAYPLNNAVLTYFTPGETIHFRLDTNILGDGWQPAANAVACSHALPEEADFELIGSPPELGEWVEGIPVVMSEDLWVTPVVIAEPGFHEYKYRVVGTWDVCNLGRHYNMFIGENFTFETHEPQAAVRFEFHPLDGRARAVVEESVATEGMSWGGLKSVYR